MLGGMDGGPLEQLLRRALEASALDTLEGATQQRLERPAVHTAEHHDDAGDRSHAGRRRIISGASEDEHGVAADIRILGAAQSSRAIASA